MGRGYACRLAVCLVVGLLSTAVAQAQSDSDKVRMIENEAAGWSRNMDRLLSSYTEDVSYEDPGMSLNLKGKEQVRGFAQSFFDAFPDLKAEIVSTVVAGDRAASEWRFSGTQVRDLPGIPAANKRMDVLGASIYEFENGKIKRKVDYWDVATAMRQLGVLPATK